MFETVVVPLDGSDLAANALPAASAVARGCGARLVVVRVVRTVAEEVEAEQELHRVAERVDAVRTEVSHRERSVARAIADVVAESPEPLVCMSTHGRSGLGRALLGSVAEGVIQHVDGPLLLVGPNADIGALPLVGQVTVCLDGSAGSEGIVLLARRWAETFAMELDLLHVADPQAAPEPLLARWRGGEVADAGRDHGDVLGELEDSLRRDGLAPTSTVLLGWRPEPVIATHIEDRRPGVVVMATRARGGFARVALGSVAMAVVQRSPRPVLLHSLARDGAVTD